MSKEIRAWKATSGKLYDNARDAAKDDLEGQLRKITVPEDCIPGILAALPALYPLIGEVLKHTGTTSVPLTSIFDGIRDPVISPINPFQTS